MLIATPLSITPSLLPYYFRGRLCPGIRGGTLPHARGGSHEQDYGGQRVLGPDDPPTGGVQARADDDHVLWLPADVRSGGDHRICRPDRPAGWRHHRSCPGGGVAGHRPNHYDAVHEQGVRAVGPEAVGNLLRLGNGYLHVATGMRRMVPGVGGHMALGASGLYCGAHRLLHYGHADAALPDDLRGVSAAGERQCLRHRRLLRHDPGLCHAQDLPQHAGRPGHLQPVRLLRLRVLPGGCLHRHLCPRDEGQDAGGARGALEDGQVLPPTDCGQ